MSDQELARIAGDLVVQIQRLKQEVAGLRNWLAAYLDASQCVNAELGRLIKDPAAEMAPGSQAASAIGELSEYPPALIRERVEELRIKRVQLRDKEQRLAAMMGQAE